MMIESALAKLPFGPWRAAGPVVSVLRLSGVIGQTGPLRTGLSLAGTAAIIERAFAPKGQAAVALVVNSPGGSAVQSSLIARRIRDLATEKEVPVFAFCEDVAASGGYWLACAADEIWADDSSIIGSIGVVFSGFGLHGFIQRHGIERRVYTAGERKVTLDSFAPEQEEEVAHLKSIQEDIHDAFKSIVRSRRGARLNGDEEDLFSGAFWSGRQALERGLIDGIGDLRTVMRGRFGEKVQLRVVQAGRRWFRRPGFEVGGTPGLASGLSSLASELPGAALAAIEERALWARYGL
jgi:signal peptide peptidase SppA